MSQVKVIYRVSSVGIKPGDTREVEKDVADALVANGHAVKAADAPAEIKGK